MLIWVYLVFYIHWTISVCLILYLLAGLGLSMSSSTFPNHVQFYFTFCLLHFHLCLPIPSSEYPFLQNVTWVYCLSTRRQHNHTLFCLCVTWITDVAWRIIDRMWKKWCSESLIMMCIGFYAMICGLKS